MPVLKPLGVGILSYTSGARETVEPCLDLIEGCLDKPGYRRMDSGSTRAEESRAEYETQCCLGGEGDRRTSQIRGDQHSSLTYAIGGS